MNILIVDDEGSVAARLQWELREHGHSVVIATDPLRAVTSSALLGIDLVVSAVAFQGLGGLAFADRVHNLAPHLPIGFFSRAHDAIDAIEAAQLAGPVLPIDRESGIDDFVARLSVGARSFASGSGTSLPAVNDDTNATRAGAAPLFGTAPHRAVRKIKVVCRTWEKVQTLCDRYSAGKNYLALKGAHDLSIGEPILLALCLPNELTLSIGAEVIKSRAVTVPNLLESDGASLFTIELIGFSPELCTRLRSMVVAGAGGPKSGTYLRVPKRTRAASDTGSQLGTVTLRKQLDDLAKNMK